MPQAAEEDRLRMVKYFGDWSDGPPAQYLVEKGWKEDKGWFTLPEGETLDTVSEKEFQCLKFLIHEWDYGLRETNNEERKN